MIIKGSSRGNPTQLTRHLLRTDTNERVTVLEVQNPSGSLAEALDDWQLLAGLTRGQKGLYHANIDPDARYAMTPEQWQRAADVLEEELGFKGQPRAIVMHEKHGRQHIHVVWQRTDIEREILLTDSHNYKAHERASAQLEKEFGHENVPGAHQKRDRSKPRLREAFNHAEWQQAERTGKDPRARKAEITALYNAADNAQAFRAALDQNGYQLAQGDRRAYVLVDRAGEVYSLARNIAGARTKEIKERLSAIDIGSLPTVEEARTMQKEKSAAREQTPELPLPSMPPEQPAPVDEHHFPPQPDPAHLRAWRIAEKRHAALEADLEERRAAELQALQNAHAQSIADTLGVPPAELAQWLSVIEGSRFAPEHMRRAEQARPAPEQEQRRAVLAEIQKMHAAERREAEGRYAAEQHKLADEHMAEVERIGVRFARERERAEEADRAKQEKEEAQERERSGDDDFGHTRP